ncbi:hypothetical protein, partial [Kitasatospora sp. NPDC058492]|uniref:hypothetical protein n=1 Tax=Kitasatospora sp. NPDC058492 TaxID=3346527 RepID=UPI00364AD99F
QGRAEPVNAAATAALDRWEPGSAIVLIGPPASGKSTWTAARFPSSARVSLDFYRGLLTDDETNQHRPQ